MTDDGALRLLIAPLLEDYEMGNPRIFRDWKGVATDAGIPEDLARRVVARLRAEGSVKASGSALLQLTADGYRQYVSGPDYLAGTPADVACIRYPQQFHELCRDLLHAEFSRAQTYEGSGGDAGVDGYDPDTETIFQFHGPEFPIRKEKLQSYLDKASQHPARRWVLLSKRDLTPKQSAWLKSPSTRYNFAIEVWGPSRLNQLLDKHPQIARRYSPPSTAQPVPSISIRAQHAEQIVNVVGPTVIKASKPSVKRAPIPGTVGADPYMKGELQKLVGRLADFRCWEKGKDKAGSIFAAIYKNFLKEFGFGVFDTPKERFGEAVDHFRRKIDNTKLGRINRGKGQPNYRA